MAGRLASWIGRALLPRRRNLLRDEGGVTAIEFGLLALPFFSILAAILETSIVFLAGQVLDSAVQDVSRLVRTGQAQQASMTPARFKELVCDRLYGLFPNCTDLYVDMRVVGTFDEVDMTPPVNWTCDPRKVGETEAQAAERCAAWTRPESYVPGTGTSIVAVQVYYKWPVIVPFGGLGLRNLPDGRRLIGAATVFRNEPFS